MEDINQIHGSTQTIDLLKNTGEYKDEIPNKIGIKDFFPKTKKILAHKNQKIQVLEPLEVLNKFRKKVFGVSDYQKKLTFKAKKNQKKLEIESHSGNWALDVKKVSPPKTQKSFFSGTHSFFPKFSGAAAEKPKKTFITDISKSKAKKLFFSKAKDEAPDNDTVYSSYVLKDFASPNKNELDINLNYNTFYALFNKEQKFFKGKNFSAKNVAEFDKEKKLMSKIERRIQTEFLQKISFPPNEKFMNKTLNNFNFNKGLYKINDLRGALTPADKLRNLVSDKDQAAKSSLSPSSKNKNNFSNTGINFAVAKQSNASKENFNYTAQNFHSSNFNINNFNKFNSNKNNTKNEGDYNSNKKNTNKKQKSISREPREKRGSAREAQLRLNDYYAKSKNIFNDLDKLYKSKFLAESEEFVSEPVSSRSKQTRNLNAQCSGLSGRKSPQREVNTFDLSDVNQVEKKLYTFNLHQGANAHVLRMLRINQKHEKLGLTKRAMLGPNAGLNEKLLREKLRNNLDGIVKRQQQQIGFNNNNNINSSINGKNNRNEFGNFGNRDVNNSDGITFNVTFNTFNIDKSKFVKINKNLFNSSDLPDLERKYYERKRDKDYDGKGINDNNFNHKNNQKTNNKINNNNIYKESDLLNNSESKNLEKYSINLDEEKSNLIISSKANNKNESSPKIFINDNNNNDNSESNSNNNSDNKNNIYADKIEALNEEYENKTNSNNNNEKETLENNLNNTQNNATSENEGILFEEKTASLKSKNKENADLISSPHISMEKIISKKTFENLNKNPNNNKAENSAANEEQRNSSKRNVVLNGKQSSKKIGSMNLVKNSNAFIENKTVKGNKTTLLQRQPNNQDISGLQVEGLKE